MYKQLTSICHYVGFLITRDKDANQLAAWNRQPGLVACGLWRVACGLAWCIDVCDDKLVSWCVWRPAEKHSIRDSVRALNGCNAGIVRDIAGA